MELPSTKPYLLRAIWEWCCDNGFTPYIAVKVDQRTLAPREYVQDGQIVLNIGPDASNRLQMGNELIDFQARFAGTPRQLSIPVDRVLAIYARENGAGMSFEVEDAVASTPAAGNENPDPDEPPPRPPTGRPYLQRVK